MNRAEVLQDTWMNRKDEMFDYVKFDILCTASGYAKYSKCSKKFTGFGLKNSFTSPSLDWKHFNSSRDESDEPIYTYKDKSMRWFKGQSNKGGRCTVFIQNYESRKADKIFEAKSQDLIVK